jgi:gluconokinase
LSSESTIAIVVMGVQGVGKTTVGKILAERLGVPFIDGDRLHPPRNVELMKSGKALNDEDRAPWLKKVGETFLEHQQTGGIVVACSALKKSYREILRSHYQGLYFVEPYGPISLVQQRIGTRVHEYMPASLLESQYQELEPLAEDENGIRVSVDATPEEVSNTVLENYLAQAGK